MKKLLLGALALVAVFSLAACGEKKEEEQQPVENVPAVVEEQTEPAVVPTPEENVEVEEEQVGVGNTDEGMIALVVEQQLRDAYGPVIKNLNFTSIKVYTPEEVEADEAIKSHDLKEGDMAFSVEYEFEVADEVEDLNQFTAANGEIDGRWIRNKSNIGIARSGENGYTMDAFGTGW